MFNINDLIEKEYQRQSKEMELIASENYQSTAVLHAQSSVFANKYSEGYPGRRYYGGQTYTDQLEQLAIDQAKKIFHADHANVQALSGAAANLAVYAGLLEPGDTILGMDLSHGGHLTHGSPVTFFSKIFNFIPYKTDLQTGKIDFDHLRILALEHRPKMILAGFSAYPRELEYEKFSSIANEVGAIAFADVSHIGGFIAAGLLHNPLDHGFHLMMSTTHKSLKGPRGALILSKGVVSNPLKKPADTIENIPTRIDRAVFPGMQGGPHMHTIAAIAVALWEAQTPDFLHYAKQTLENAQVMAQEFLKRGYRLITGGTDNHMVVVDFSQTPLKNGKNAESLLDQVGISTSKSMIPDDPNPPFAPSGLRIGIQAMTSRGVDAAGTIEIVELIDRTLQTFELDTVAQDAALKKIKAEVCDFCLQYPLPE